MPTPKECEPPLCLPSPTAFKTPDQTGERRSRSGWRKALGGVAIGFAIWLNLGAGSPAAAQIAADENPGRLVTVGQHRIFVQVFGPEGAPPVLYLHGGPGAGAFEFSEAQGERLGRELRVYVIDQRGVLRSDSIGEGETVSTAELVADAEALREQFGLERWSVIGHSYGGYIAAAYLDMHPEHLDRVIFENPSFDLGSSARSLLRQAATLYQELGNPELAEAAASAAESQDDTPTIWSAFGRLTNGLGAARQRLYFHSDPTFFDGVVSRSGLGDQWSRGMVQQRALYTEGSIFEPKTDPVSRHVGPMLLIRGRFDRVTAPDQVAAFCRAPQAWIAVFEESSHFVHVEEADLFAATVTAFVKNRTMPMAQRC